MECCSKRGIVKASELPVGDYAGHTAWGLCRETVSSQGLISPTLSSHPCFTLPVKSLNQHLPTFSYRSKNSLLLLCIQLHSCTHAVSLHLHQGWKRSTAILSLLLWLYGLTSETSISSFLNCFIVFQNYVSIPSTKLDIFLSRCWNSVRGLGISSCHLKQFMAAEKKPAKTSPVIRLLKLTLPSDKSAILRWSHSAPYRSTHSQLLWALEPFMCRSACYVTC